MFVWFLLYIVHHIPHIVAELLNVDANVYVFYNVTHNLQTVFSII